MWEIGFGLAGQRCWGETYPGGRVLPDHQEGRGWKTAEPLGVGWENPSFLYHPLWSTQRSTHTACGWKTLLIAVLMHFCSFYCSALSQILGEEGRYRGVKVASSEKENVGGRRNCVRQGVTKAPRREAGRGAEQGDREGRLGCAGEAVEAGRAGVERS